VDDRTGSLRHSVSVFPGTVHLYTFHNTIITSLPADVKIKHESQEKWPRLCRLTDLLNAVAKVCNLSLIDDLHARIF